MMVFIINLEKEKFKVKNKYKCSITFKRFLNHGNKDNIFSDKIRNKKIELYENELSSINYFKKLNKL